MSADPIRAAALAIRATRTQRAGRLLRNYRLDCSEAIAHRRKGRLTRSERIIDDARGKLMNELFRSHSVFRVLKHAHSITAILQRVERAEAADLFHSDRRDP